MTPVARPGSRPERVAPWGVAALALAVAGASLSIWRPTAPVVGNVPTDLATFSDGVLAAVDAYRGPRYVVGVVATLLEVAVPVAVVLSPVGRRLIARVAGPAAHSPWRAGLVAVAIAAATWAAIWPLAAWSRVVHDGRWGFRTQSALAWFGDWLMVSGIRWIGYGLGAVVLVVAIRRWPRSWPYRLTVLGPLIAAVVILVHPVAFLPLLYSIDPLPDDGPAATAIDEVVAAAGEADVPLVVVDESRRSTRVNAFVTGLGPTRRLVLFDTLLELPPERVAAVVAHELAHAEHRDIERGLALAPTALLPALVLLRRLLSAGAVERLVQPRGPTDPRLMAVPMAFAAVAMLVGQPVANHISRQLEAAADARAVEITGDASTLVRATRVFTVRDLAPPHAPELVRFLYATHPSVRERILQTVALADDPAALPELDLLEAEEAELAHPATVGGVR